MRTTGKKGNASSPEALKELAAWEKKRDDYFKSIIPVLNKWYFYFFYVE
jgi:hypothetical protein